MKEFEKSVQDIEGLTAFKLGTLPKWLSERLRGEFAAVAQDARGDSRSDAELVARLHLEWLGGWGKATINGEEVFLFLFRQGLGYYHFEPTLLADELDCGWHEVEDSDHCRTWDMTTMFFSQHCNRVLHRRTVNGAVATSQV